MSDEPLIDAATLLKVPAAALRSACNRAGLCLRWSVAGHTERPCICSVIEEEDER